MHTRSNHSIRIGSCWQSSSSQFFRSAGPMNLKWTEDDEFKISQRPASTHFKSTEAASTHFIFKSDQTFNIADHMQVVFVSIWFPAFSDLMHRIWESLEVIAGGQRSFLKVRYDFLPIRITPLQTCKSCLITLKPWSSASFDLCWCRMDLFPTKTKQVNWGLANFFPAGHLKSPGWPFRQVCDRFPYFIHFRTDFNVLFIRRLRSWSFRYFPKVYDHEDIATNETSWYSKIKIFLWQKDE